MKGSNWRYKIGTDMFSFIPITVLLVVFGGVSVWLYIKDNGIVLFTGFLTALVLCIAVYNVYRCLFVKLLIGEDGFYLRTKPGNGKYYDYTEITEAWESEGKSANGVVNYYLNYKTADGNTVKFPFNAAQSESAEYLLSRINNTGDADNGETY
ncbi:MAG: hypothetical protein IJZ90_04100 [Clostridia bacterium]|nr:hypothetical protein [Clostridia bacterium]